MINKREKVGLNHFNDPKAFMEYSNDMQDVYKNIEDYNPIKKSKVLVYKKYKLFDVTKFILVLPTFRLKQQSLSRTRC